MQSKIKKDAIILPYRLKRWWEDSSPSSERLKAISSKDKAFDDQIPYLDLVNKMSKSLNLHCRPETLFSKNREISSIYFR